MERLILAEDAVWQSYYDIPDDIDRREAWTILRGLVDDPYPPNARLNHWGFAGHTWLGYSIDLSSGNGFIAYSPFITDDGLQAVRLWPMTWSDLDL